MSRIGKKAVSIPDGVTATLDDGLVKVKGPKGELSTPMVDDLAYELSDGGLLVTPANKTTRARAYWGMQRTLVQNLVDGVRIHPTLAGGGARVRELESGER